ncbi:MAG: DUF6728 family protein [Bacteroidota bacterium]
MQQKSEAPSENNQREKVRYFDFSEVFGYFFRKKDPNRPKNFNIKAMHTINKISILMFLCAVIVMIVRAFTRS